MKLRSCISSIWFYGSNEWFPGEVRLRKKNYNALALNGLVQKVLLLIRSTLIVCGLRISCQLLKPVFDDVVLVLNGCLPIYASDFWEIRIGDPRERLSDKLLRGLSVKRVLKTNSLIVL